VVHTSTEHGLAGREGGKPARLCAEVHAATTTPESRMQFQLHWKC
jgi:hypothetical protein